jgi:hypothetical protein
MRVDIPNPDRHPVDWERPGAHDGSKVSPRLAAILATRARSDAPAEPPRCLTASQLDTLRAVLLQVVPHDIAGLDLAQRIDKNLYARIGDGWRTETLPDDAQAYRLALDSLDAASRRDAGLSFAHCAEVGQHRMLASVAEQTFIPCVGDGLDPRQMAVWFDDLRSDAVRLYVAHPQAIASIGYEGHANGAASEAAFEGWSDSEIEGRR